jgi:hypothetical protein
VCFSTVFLISLNFLARYQKSSQLEAFSYILCGFRITQKLVIVSHPWSQEIEIIIQPQICEKTASKKEIFNANINGVFNMPANFYFTIFSYLPPLFCLKN